MNPRRHRFHLALTFGLLGCLTACGGTDGGATDAAASSGAQRVAVSSNPSYPLATTKAGKPEPSIRPGAEAPLDSAPDQVSKIPGTLLFASSFEGSLLFSRDLVDDHFQHLDGRDATGYLFPIALGSAIAGWPSRINAEVGNTQSIAPDDFASASLATVTGRNGLPTRALALHNKAKSRAIDAQQISLESSGLAADPVAYQRMWVKFDANTLARARAHGTDNFYQTFWEVTSKGDFWLRLKLHMDPAGRLVWVAKANGLAVDGTATGGEPAWITRLDSVPVTLAEESDAAGWHHVEIWLDSIAGRFKVSVDGQPLVDRAGIRAANGEHIDTWRLMMVGSTVAPISRVLFDDLELWSAPPADAWERSQPEVAYATLSEQP